MTVHDDEAIVNAIQVGRGKYWEWLEKWLVTQPPLPYHVEGKVLTFGEQKYPLPEGAVLITPVSASSNGAALPLPDDLRAGTGAAELLSCPRGGLGGD